MKKLLIIGADSKIAERFIDNMNGEYEIYATYRTDKLDRKTNVHYMFLDLSDRIGVRDFTSSINGFAFSGVFLFASTYSKDAILLEEYLVSAEKDLLINAFSPIAICKNLRYASPATIFLFNDAGLLIPKKNFSSYSISKEALNSLGKILAVELAHQARVVTFKLGPTLASTNKNDQENYYHKNLYQVDDPSKGLVRYCQFLINENNLSMTGTDIIYDGGAYIKR